MTRVNWLSSLPDKFRSRITRRVRELALSQGDTEVKNDYRVIVRVGTNSASEPTLRPAAGSTQGQPESLQQSYVRNYDSVSIAVTRLDHPASNARLVPVAIPRIQQPKFHSHPQVFSKEYVMPAHLPSRRGRKVTVFSPGLEEGAQFDRLFETHKELLKFPEGFYERQCKVNSTYSMKYLGVTEGKIGILSKRVPMGQSEPPPRRNVVTCLQTRLGKQAKNKTLIAFQPKKSVPTPAKALELPTPQPEPEDSYVPISATSLTEMFRRGIAPSPSQQVLTPMKECPQSKSSSPSPQPDPTIMKPRFIPSEPFRQVASQSRSPPIKRQCKPISKPQTTDVRNTPSITQQQAETSVPVAFAVQEDPMVHTYSFPKALTAGKKSKVWSEAERFFEDKYSSEHVLSAIYPRKSGVLASKLLGPRGQGLPIGELFRSKLLLARLRNTGGIPSVRSTCGPEAFRSGHDRDHDSDVGRNMVCAGCGMMEKGVEKEPSSPCVLQNSIIKERSLAMKPQGTQRAENEGSSGSNSRRHAPPVMKEGAEQKQQQPPPPQVQTTEETKKPRGVTVNLVKFKGETGLSASNNVEENNKLINMLLEEEGATAGRFEEGNAKIVEEAAKSKEANENVPRVTAAPNDPLCRKCTSATSGTRSSNSQLNEPSSTHFRPILYVLLLFFCPRMLGLFRYTTER